MRYCMTLSRKGYQKYDSSKLKVQLLLSKYRLWSVISVIDGPRRLSCGSTSSICQDILKSDNLMHKRRFPFLIWKDHNQNYRTEEKQNTPENSYSHHLLKPQHSLPIRLNLNGRGYFINITFLIPQTFWFQCNFENIEVAARDPQD